MPDKKLTDTEIKKALECCYTTGTRCEDCPLCDIEECNDTLMAEYVKDLINRLQSENERLHKEVGYWEAETKEARADIDQAVAEAYKECVEKVKEIIPAIDDTYIESMVEEHLDNLVKEMVGENNETKTF